RRTTGRSGNGGAMQGTVADAARWSWASLSLGGDEGTKTLLDHPPHLSGETEPVDLSRLVADRIDERRDGPLRHVAGDGAPSRQGDVFGRATEPVRVSEGTAGHGRWV